MELRERLFFGVSEVSAWKFAGTNTLAMLRLMSRELHGRGIQQMMLSLFDDIWTMGNDLLYTMLGKFEQEGYVKSRWDAKGDPHKRHIRYYWLTERGSQYLNTIRSSFLENLAYMQRIFDKSLDTLWGDRSPQPAAVTDPSLLSSTAFSTVNILHLLSVASKADATDGSGPWRYARVIKEHLHDLYEHAWEPSDGVLYPRLSIMENQGFLESRWVEPEDGDQKRRTVREYRITPEGEALLARLLSAESGLKNKILGVSNLCRKSSRLIRGNDSAISKALGTVNH